MFNNLVPPMVCGIIFFTVYKIIELFARRNERMAIIEKLSDNLDPSIISKQIKSMTHFSNLSFTSLKLGSLCVGIGLGLLVGYFIVCNSSLNYGNWDDRGVMGIIYGATILLFGGTSLLIAFLIEMKLTKKD